MHDIIQKYENIISSIKSKLEKNKNDFFPTLVAVSKTFSLDKIKPLIDHGHLDFGENKVQEAIDKWTEIKSSRHDIKLHLIGRLQTNKVKYALKIFDYIHSVDSKKLAKKIADEQQKQKKKVKIFIQVNIGNEEQKSGVSVNELHELMNYSKEVGLDVIGLMCIPPANIDPFSYFKEMKKLNYKLKLNELSMGMSSDYLNAIECGSTYLRIGSSLFGSRD